MTPKDLDQMAQHLYNAAHFMVKAQDSLIQMNQAIIKLKEQLDEAQQKPVQLCDGGITEQQLS